MQKVLEQKVHALRAWLREQTNALLAFSGGVDSACLGWVAAQELGERCLAVTVVSPFLPAWERENAQALARTLGLRHRELEQNPLADDSIVANTPDRCYHCKRLLFSALQALAQDEGIACVMDGSNVDDADDYRPGRRALQELGIYSPLEDAGLGKDEIRQLSKEAGLPTWDQPAAACLASRIPYGNPLTDTALRQVEAAESALHAMGIRHCRVRHHGEVARIEVPQQEIASLAASRREEIARAIHAAGFRYTTLDLDGYRTGSLNAGISTGAKEPI